MDTSFLQMTDKILNQKRITIELSTYSTVKFHEYSNDHVMVSFSVLGNME